MAPEALHLACFGKLPFWPEYLEHGVRLPTSRALREWLHRGKEASSLTDSVDDQPVAADVAIRTRLRLLVGLPGSAELLVGVLRPSTDRGGRNFPFAVYSHVPRRSFGKHYALLPLALAPVWNELDEAWDALAGVASKGSFEELLDSIRVSQPEPPKQVQGAYELGQQSGLEELFDRSDGATPKELIEAVPRIVARLKPRDARVSLQLPVSTESEKACYDASFWIDLFNRQFFMRRLEPSVLLEGDRSATDRLVSLRFGPLEPADFPRIAGLDDGDSDMLRPAHGAGSTASGDPVQGLTYADLLRKKFGSGSH